MSPNNLRDRTPEQKQQAEEQNAASQRLSDQREDEYLSAMEPHRQHINALLIALGGAEACIHLFENLSNPRQAQKWHKAEADESVFRRRIAVGDV